MKRFRFSLRFLFLLVAVCAMVLGWRQWSVRWIEKRHNLRSGAFMPARGVYRIKSPTGPVRPKLPLSLAVWSEGFAINEFDVVSGDASPDEINELKSIFPEAQFIWKTREEWEKGESD